MANHTDNSFINLRYNTTFEFHFFHFFEEGLNQYSEMELNFSGFVAGVSINVFDLNNLGHILNDLDDSVKLVNFHNIDKLLTKELSESAVHLIIKFGVLGEKFFVICRK